MDSPMKIAEPQNTDGATSISLNLLQNNVYLLNVNTCFKPYRLLNILTRAMKIAGPHVAR
jgi:hypothetical protein